MRIASQVKTSPRPATDPELPALHRLAIVYLLLPVVIWLASWFDWWVGLPAVALLACAFRRPLSGSWKPPPPSATVAAVLAAAAVLVMMTAAGGVFDVHNRPDWQDHRVKLVDLGRSSPAYLADPLAPWRTRAEPAPATPPLLRYYLGWYMAPGLAARWWGPAALNWAVPLWTWAGAALMALLFTRRRRGRDAVLAFAVLFFFNGMDFVRVPVTEGKEWIDRYVEINGWPAFVLQEERPFALTSRFNDLLWAPQHLFPAGLGALLCLQLRRHPRFLAVLGVLLAAAAFWSPFVAVGLLPLLAVVLWENGVRPLLRWPNLCLAGPLFGLVALYLTAGTLDFPRGWIWETYDWPELTRRLLVFYLTEFLLLALLLLAVRPALRREPFFIVAVATLLLLPVYCYNDLNAIYARGAVPSHLLLSWFCAGAVTRRSRAAVRRGGGRRAAFAGLALVLGVGAITPAADLARSLGEHGSFRYEQAGRTTLIDLPRFRRREKVAYDVPELLRLLLREPPDVPARRRPGEPLVRSVFDVHLDDGKLIHVRDRCAPADLEAPFFAHVIPVSPDDLPRHLLRSGFERRRGRRVERYGDRCVAAISLPEYPVARVVTGQRASHGVIWRTEIVFDAVVGQRESGGRL